MQYRDKLYKWDQNLSMYSDMEELTRLLIKFTDGHLKLGKFNVMVFFRSVYKYKNLVLESVDLHKNMIAKELNY